MDDANKWRADVRTTEINVIFTGNFTLSVPSTMASYTGQQFTTPKPANNIWRNTSSSSLKPCLNTSTAIDPFIEEAKLIMAAVVIDKKKGGSTPNSNSPCSYRLLCSWSWTSVTFKPKFEIPMNLRKYSMHPMRNLRLLWSSTFSDCSTTSELSHRIIWTPDNLVRRLQGKETHRRNTKDLRPVKQWCLWVPP